MPFNNSLDNLRWSVEVDSEANRDAYSEGDDAFEGTFSVELFTNDNADHVNVNMCLPPDTQPCDRYDSEFLNLTSLVRCGHDLVEALAGFADLIQPSNIERMSLARAERATRLRNEALRLTNIFGVWS
jgi:hypothetical protein